ncbi:MAG: bifunctional DNA-formamidopyrimidine glycosylase/DNA-(apurinic or apyrimidinic site) lyase [Pseudomonadota bacterium]
MPELPEVETTKRGISPHILRQTVSAVRIRQKNLRWPVPDELAKEVTNTTIESIRRRGKYLLLESTAGTVILHLGMSGSLRVVPADTVPGKHDHIDFVFGEACLRLRDPRRFGAVLWTRDDVLSHPLLAPLGPEPLSPEFNGAWLYGMSRGRKIAVKAFIMDSRSVVGVGNIYANEALFLAGIRPGRPAGRISAERYATLANCICSVLEDAIHQGGTTLRDFVNEAGRPGYFQQTLNVYGREGAHCPHCGTRIRSLRLGQRSSFFCPSCQRS